VLRPADAQALAGLTDSKLLTAARRQHYYDLIVARAVSRSVVVIPPADVDELGVHAANLEGMRRAVAGLAVHPGYVLTDGFRVPDRAAACVSAASVLAKVTRDRIMLDLHADMPWYGFGEHKGYCTPEHNASLLAHGPCAEHRFSYVNVVMAARAHGLAIPSRRRASLLPPGCGPEWVVPTMRGHEREEPAPDETDE
jgi:ribonuclease HII